MYISIIITYYVLILLFIILHVSVYNTICFQFDDTTGKQAILCEKINRRKE